MGSKKEPRQRLTFTLHARFRGENLVLRVKEAEQPLETRKGGFHRPEMNEGRRSFEGPIQKCKVLRCLGNETPE